MADLTALLTDLQNKQQALLDAQSKMTQATSVRDQAQQYIWRGLEGDVQKLRDQAAKALNDAQTAYEAQFSVTAQATQARDEAKRALNAAILGFGVGTGNEL